MGFITTIKTKLYPHWFVRNKDLSLVHETEQRIANAIIDPKGLGMLDLMLPQYYDIFYTLFAASYAQGAPGSNFLDTKHKGSTSAILGGGGGIISQCA